MLKFRVPFWIHDASSKTKARVVEDNTLNDGMVEFEAPTIAAAKLKAEELILPGDPRLIRGRNFIGFFSN